MHIRHASVPGLLLMLGLCLSRPLAAAEPAALEIGILPTLSTRTILTTYQPLREYLQTRLKRPVTLVTAPDYRTYIDRTRRREYRFLITAPHFARLAQVDTGYVPIARIQRELQGVVVTQQESPVHRIEDLRGRQLSTPEDIAVITMLGLRLLREHGLQPDKDVTLQMKPSFNSAMLAVQNNEVAAALTAPTAIKQMPETLRANLRIIAHTRIVPHNIVLAHPQVPRAEVEKMTRLLIEFKDDQKYGAPFFQSTGFNAFTRPTEQELRSIDPYVTELRRMLARR